MPWSGTRRCRCACAVAVSRPRRRSSGVEHSLGKGGVGSSILPGGTVSFQELSLDPRTTETGDNCANAQKRPSPVRGISPPEQPELPLAAAPATVRWHGLRAAHPFPLVSPGKRPERPYTSVCTTPEKAWHFPEVVVGRSLLTLRNTARSMDYRADRHRTYAPINSHGRPVPTVTGESPPLMWSRVPPVVAPGRRLRSAGCRVTSVHPVKVP